MRKSARHPNLAMIFVTDLYSDVMSKCGATDADIHRNVKNAATQNHHQLTLRARVLEMEPTYHPVSGTRQIVLDEWSMNPV